MVVEYVAKCHMKQRVQCAIVGSVVLDGANVTLMGTTLREYNYIGQWSD